MIVENNRCACTLFSHYCILPHLAGARTAAGDGRRHLTGAHDGRGRLAGGWVRDAGRVLVLPGLARGGAAHVAPTAGEVAATASHLGDAWRRI